MDGHGRRLAAADLRTDPHRRARRRLRADRETPVACLEPGNGQTRLGYLWTCARPGGDTVFTWHTSRAAACLETILPRGWRGAVQSDGCAAYFAFVRQHNAAAGIQAIILAACWAHVRRAIFKARESAPRTSGWLLHQIALPCRIEAHLRACKAGPRLRAAVRAAVRAAHSAPILRRIHAALKLIRSRHLPQSALGKAITYTLDLWPALERFLAHGRIESERSGDSLPQAARRASVARQIDNNGVKNAIRPTALGKKNWLFIGAAHAGERGAILYTIVESCRRRGIDPIACLRDVLTRLPRMTISQIPEVTPEAWVKAQRQGRESQAAA